MGAAGSSTITFAIRGPIARADLPGLCERVCALLSGQHCAVVDCDVTAVRADAVTVDALARLQLAAHRYGCRIQLRRASPELLALLSLMGLADVVPG
jgi:ABC-type transporter Mla MlaB component